MRLQKLQFNPGIVRDTTSYSNQGGWFDCDLVRFRLGFPESFGGWVREFEGRQFVGTARSLFRWRTLSGNELLGFGTHQKYYIELGQGYYDITPITRSVTLNGPFSATTGSSLIEVTDVGNGRTEGSFVTFSDAVSLGGDILAAVLNVEHEIITIVGSDTYLIDVGVNATASDTGDGGATVAASYQVVAGLDTQIGGNGWNAGSWGEQPWGEGATSSANTELRLWAQDSFGEDLIFNVRNGAIFFWDASSGLVVRGVELQTLTADANVPTIATQVLVSDRDRHVIVFGANADPSAAQDPLLIRFSDQEDPTVWTSTSTNTAGDLRLGSGNRIIKAIETKREILIWTDSAVYSMQFIGPPFTFGVQQVSSYVTINGFNSFISVEDTVYWMGRDVFYMYDGRVVQMVCPVENFIFSDYNFSQRDKVFAGVNTQFSEVIWFYPSAESDENDSYVVYNYESQSWYYGKMARTVWLDCCPSLSPIAAAPDKRFYRHEVGANNGENDPPTPLSPFIESSQLEIAEGTQKMAVSRLIPDVRFFGIDSLYSTTLSMTITMQDYPGTSFGQNTESSVSKTASFPVQQFTDKIDLRLRGRSMRLRVESSQLNTRWSLGTQRVSLAPDGRR